jgi:hypothetical protein
MSSRRSSASLFLAVGTLAFAVTASGLAIGACSSETSSGDGATEAGVDAATDTRKVIEASPTPPDEDSGVLTPEQCEAKCKADMPAAAALYEGVDVCWAAKCKGPCVDGTGMFDAGDAGDDADAGDGGDAAPNDGNTELCTSTYSSGTDKACDDCTEAFCCPAWDGCFNNQSCKDYNDCIGDCNP